MIAVGAFVVRPLDQPIRVRGETTSSQRSVGRATLYEVTGSENVALTVRDAFWGTGERDVVTDARNESPERFDTLVGRLRLSVLDRDGPYVELRQARIRPNGRAGLFGADWATLDAGAGCDVEKVLLSHGATRVAERELLQNGEGPARGRIGVRFPEEAQHVPVVAYVLTRIGPVAAGMSA